MNRYSKKLFWSTGEDCWVCEVSELEGCFSEGKTQEEALHNSTKAIADWISFAEDFGITIPRPACELNIALA